MSQLDIYDKCGFKFFLCRADKSPDVLDGESWKDEKYHLSKEQAETYQSTGRMIGGWLPEKIIVINLDRRGEEIDGVKTLRAVKEKYKIKYGITENTLTVLTAGNGIHIFLQTSDIWRHGKKDEGINLITHEDYVIVAGSPGYKILHDNEPSPVPKEIEKWLITCEKKEKAKEAREIISGIETNIDLIADSAKDSISSPPASKKLLPVASLKRILNKIDKNNFVDVSTWLEFVAACIDTAGAKNEIFDVVENWTQSEPKFSDNRTAKKYINSIEKLESYRGRTFLQFLKDDNISQYIINQIVKLDNISTAIIEAENSEIDLPFPDPDYDKLSESPAAREFFKFKGNTSAATILESAADGYILYDNSTKANYYYDGNKWVKLTDYYGIIYTIICRVIKIIYQKNEADKESNDKFFKCISTINGTGWKDMTWKEFNKKPGIYNDAVLWDSPVIMESITAKDGVIDFSNNEITKRGGMKSEFRLSHFDYTVDEIMESGTPVIFSKFFDDLFLDKDTRKTAKYCVSMAISGNSGKRLFQLWKGIGSNGKSTLVETISKVLGKDKSYKYPSEILLSGNKYENFKSEKAKFRGKYFCYSSEADKGARLSQNTIKDMTGDEVIQGKVLYENPIEFEATWQLIYAVNDLPSFHGEDFAFNDRLLVLPFNTVFWKDKDKKQSAINRGVDEKHMVKADSSQTFKESLYSEKAGIIMWMIKNYVELNTEHGGVIPESPECILNKIKYIKDNNETGVFIEELCEIDVTGKEGWYILPDDLVAAYRDFTGLKKKGSIKIVKEIVGSHSSIGREVRRVPRSDEYGNRVNTPIRVVTNISLKDDVEKPESEKPESEKPEKKRESKDINIDEIPF
jgi:phage/plasmid-associated DNA primase